MLESRRLLSVAGDGFGYVADAEPGQAVDLVPGEVGVNSILTNDVGASAPVDLGANTFSFYGETYTGDAAVFVSTNGLITFGAPSDAYPYYNGDLSSGPTPPTVAPLWDVWATDRGDVDQVLTAFRDTNDDGADDQLVVEWNVVQHLYESPTDRLPVTFQAILSLNTGDVPGDVVFNYPDLDTGVWYRDNGGTASVGIKDAGYQAANRLLVSYYPYYYGATGLVGSNQAVRIHWAGNDGPTADAGGPYTATEGWFTTLYAGDSTDPQQPYYTLTYEWDLDGDTVFGEYVGDGALNGNEVGYYTEFDAFGLHAGDVQTVTLRVTDGGRLVSTDTAEITITENNDPTADAGPWWADSYTVVEGRYTPVYAYNSWDAEQGNYLDYTWNLDGDQTFGESYGDGGDNGNEYGIETDFVAGELQAGDSKTITLRATDRAGGSDEDTANVNVVANQAPVVDAGGPYEARPDRYVQLNGGGTYDPDEGLDWYQFQWDLDGDGNYGEAYWNGGDPQRGEEVGPYPYFYTSGLGVGEILTVSLRVTDSSGLPGEDAATVEIFPNRDPVADAGPPPWYGEYTVNEGSGLYLWGYDSFDPDGDYLNYEWDLDNDGNFGEAWWNGGDPTHGDETGPQPFFYASGIDGTVDYPVALRVTDPDGRSHTDTTFVRVMGSKPLAVILGAQPTSVEGAAYTLEGQVVGRAGNDNSGLTFSWVVTKDGAPYLTGDERLLTFVPEDEGDYRATFAVTDATGDVSASTPANDVSFKVVNAAPRLNGLSVDNAAVEEGGTVTLTGSYNDLGAGDGHALTIDWGDGVVETIDLPAIGVNLPVSTPWEFNGHTYYAILGGRLNWEQAQAQAERLGGNLVTIDDAAENAFVADFVYQSYAWDLPAWIGLHDSGDGNEGAFAWASGEPVGYTNWSGGEPNDYRFIPDGEDYGVINWGFRGGWNDLPLGGTAGGQVFGAIIEVAGPPPDPAALAPTFNVSHTYRDDTGGADPATYQITATLADEDGAAAAPAPFVQWAEAAGGNGHYYRLSSVATAEDAEAEAVAMGGHLVGIGSEAEQRFLEDSFLAWDQNRKLWIGLTDSASEGEFAWASGEDVTYTNWHGGEPNDFGGGQDFAVINFRPSGSPMGLWDDDGGPRAPGLRFFGIIELPGAPAGSQPPLSVTVSNAAPDVSGAGSDAGAVGDAAPGEQVTVWADFLDAGFDDTHTLTVDWGDGSVSGPLAVPPGGRSASADHTYAQGGVYTATLTITDDDGGTDSQSVTVYVSGSGIHNGQLQVVGTHGTDHLTIQRLTDGGLSLEGGALLTARVAASAVPEVRSILLLLGDGDDRATIVSANTVPVFINGGAGNDQINGGNGPNVLLGGGGDDMLIGGSDRDILIGGRGADHLVGNGGDDILVAGRTTHDADPAALAALIADWAGAGTLQQRISRLTAGVGPGGPFALNGSTVSDDAATDVLTGGAGGDWFAVAADAGRQINDSTPADLVLHTPQA